jgi:hypothetical protein
MKEHEMDFTTWFEIFSSKLKRLGHDGPIDKESARLTFDEDIDGELYPEDAARNLWKEWGN